MFTYRLLFIDDTQEDAERCAGIIKRAFNKAAAVDPATGVKLRVEVEVLHAGVDESGESFVERIRQRLRCRHKPGTDGAADAYHGVLADWRFSDLNFYGTPVSGIEILQEVGRLAPSALRLLLTAFDPQSRELTELDPGVVFYEKRQLRDGASLKQLLKSIRENFAERMRTPYWSALQEYAQGRKAVMHAMAAIDMRSMRGSVSAGDFLKFFGENYFGAEASLTLAPLDSLLEPKGSLKDAQALYARRFGSRQARFCTNGTSTANAIVSKAVCSRGDVIVLDRNCHGSHHYAYATAGVTPIFVHPRRNGIEDEFSAVHPDELGKVFQQFLAAGQDPATCRLPACVSITNCTFDGVSVRPDRYIEKVRETLAAHGVDHRLDEIVFLFDEAWWAFARFHPGLIEYTAMYQVDRLRRLDPLYRDRLRAYATHSTHKTLTAFRQASAILIDDPLMENPAGVHWQRFEQSVLAHTTTSAHAGMLASLDVARRQADLDGMAMLGRAMQTASHFRDALAQDRSERLSRTFRCVPPAEMLDKLGPDTLLDPTKVTLEIGIDLSGAQFKKALWEKEKVQFNKYSRRRALLMFTMGSEVGDSINLVNSLKAFSRSLPAAAARPRPDAPASGTARPADFQVWGEEERAIRHPGEVYAGQRWDPGRFLFGRGAGTLDSVPLADLAPLSRKHLLLAGTFVTPYPPGFPIVYPGQVLGKREIDALTARDDIEVHGLTELDGKPHMRIWKLPRR